MPQGPGTYGRKRGRPSMRKGMPKPMGIQPVGSGATQRKYLDKEVNQTTQALQGRLNEANQRSVGRERAKTIPRMKPGAQRAIGKKAIRRGGLNKAMARVLRRKLGTMGE